MNKKVIVSSILAVSLVAFSGIAYAAEQNNNTPEWFKSMIQWRKEQVNEQVKSGNITEEQGKQWNEKIDAMEEFHKDNGFTPGACSNSINEDGTTKGFGQGMMGNFKGNNSFGSGMMGNSKGNNNFGSGMMGNFNNSSQQ